MRTLALAAALLAVPVAAQSTAEVPAAPVAPATVEAPGVDPALIGAWQLDEVVTAGRLGEMDVTVEGMACDFEADGTARVEMAMVQDRDPIRKARQFAFDTEAGQIVVPDDEDVTYRVLDDGRLELETTTGLVVRLVRTGA